jgi:hypothetical protein
MENVPASITLGDEERPAARSELLKLKVHPPELLEKIMERYEKQKAGDRRTLKYLSRTI